MVNNPVFKDFPDQLARIAAWSSGLSNRCLAFSKLRILWHSFRTSCSSDSNLNLRFMSKSIHNLYGNVPEKSSVVLLMVDVINDMKFSEAKLLLRHAIPMAKQLAKLKSKAKQHGYATIYVNDNFGRWRSDFKTHVKHCLKEESDGKEIVQLLTPHEDNYFVLKPAHSGFYSTTLELLLKHIQAHTLIITGVATNMCVLFTANDAYLRGYDVYVPRDCVAANSMALSRSALKQMKTTLKAKIGKSDSLPWTKWQKEKT
jgi:nicotinamidase-related amidase